MLTHSLLSALCDLIHPSDTWIIRADPLHPENDHHHYLEIIQERQLGDQWTLDPGLDCLAHENNDNNTNNGFDHHVDYDPNCLATPRHYANSVRIKYEIIWSEAFIAPVLYFNCYIHDQIIVDLHQVLTLLHGYREDNDEDNGNNPIITQTMHPLNNLPCFFIHPCQTAAVMDRLVDKSEGVSLEYLRLWISTYGPVVGLYCI